jgi:uncharacterized protein (DUF1330 family)
MAKGYCIVRVDVRNDEGYKAYAAASPAICKKLAGQYLVRSGRFTDVEGQSRSRNVIVEFPDHESALACYRSAEYQQNMKIRQANSISDFIVIEGFDGPQA